MFLEDLHADTVLDLEGLPQDPVIEFFSRLGDMGLRLHIIDVDLSVNAIRYSNEIPWVVDSTSEVCDVRCGLSDDVVPLLGRAGDPHRPLERAE